MLTSLAMNPDLQLALALADAADEITMRYFHNEFSVRTKADRTPVTEVDEAVEQMIVDHLWQERPADGILGEELGARGGSLRRWIVDPIDATKNFIRGIPIFATLIALENELGVVTAPALGRRWWASRGDGAFCNGAPIHVSAVSDLGDAQIGYDDVAGFEQHGLGDAFLMLLRRCGRARGFGDFWTHMLVAEGAIEIAVEPRIAHWDMAAVQVIVEEAGGRFSGLNGGPHESGGPALSSNGLLHDAVVTAFAP